MNPVRAIAAAILTAPCLLGQATVTELKIHADPGARVRPHETIALQVRVYGQAGTETGRLRLDGAELKVLESDGGWISKPYRFQGEDDEEFVSIYQSRAGRIFGQISGQYVLQDGAIYTAPEKPGRYRVQASLSGRTADLTIEVNASAPSHRKAEKLDFGAEATSLDPYRDLAEHWAPVIAQETWWQHKSDYIARFDYDGDWRGDNNWERLEEGSSQAYVYYAAMETATHWFLIYNIFHPRDYSDKCVAGSCHENDNEGLILTIAKDDSAYGRLLAMETLAHNNIYSFSADDSVRGGEHNVDGKVEFHGHRPVVFIESGGHGVYGTQSSHARYDVERNEFTAGTGVTYTYKGSAERPKHGNDRWVGYDLLPIYQHWWLRNGDRRGRTFDDFFTYAPHGNRPQAAFTTISGAFYGRAMGSNMAKPFWGWHDNRTRKRDILAAGQWGLDPAYAVSRNLNFAGEFSLEYEFNPYLALDGQSVEPPPFIEMDTPASAAPAQPASESPAEPASAQGFFEVVVWVDGAAEIEVRGAEFTVRNLQGAEPRKMEVPNQPMPLGDVSELRLEVRQGRGKAEITERPSARNNYTTTIRVEDRARGGATYTLALEWKR